MGEREKRRFVMHLTHFKKAKPNLSTIKSIVDAIDIIDENRRKCDEAIGRKGERVNG